MVRGRLRVAEVPIDFADRELGSSKMDWRQQVNYLRHLYRLYLHLYGAAARLAGFALVGASGFVIDVSVYLRPAGDRRRASGGAVPLVLARGHLELASQSRADLRGAPAAAAHPAMTKFVASSMIGLAVNVGSYSVLTSFVGFFSRNHLLTLIVGVGLGGFANFLVANRYVYRRRTEA